MKKDLAKLTSFEDVSKMSYPSQPMLVDYKELGMYEDIDDLFDDKGDLILLFIQMETERTGHYVALIRKDNSIYVLNSYGMEPDKDLDYTKFNLYPELSRLLIKAYEDGKDLQYNDYQLQRLKPGIATCGRWASVFFKYFGDKNFDNLEDFLNIFKFVKDRFNVDLDELVVIMTEKYL